METVLYSEEDQLFYEMAFANVDNGGKYPGSFTKKETDWITKYSIGKILHLFSGSSTFGDVRVDLANPHATINTDVFTFLKENQTPYNTVIADPPYNFRFAEKYAKLANSDVAKQFVIFAQAQKTTEFFNALIQLKPDRIILKSWNWYVVKGYTVLYSVLCYAGGYRKPTIFLVLERKETQ